MEEQIKIKLTADMAVLESDFKFAPTSLEEISKLFTKLHNYIWRTERKTPSAAFQELMKIVFIKIKKDHELYDKLGSNSKPKVKDVVFCVNWIRSQTEVDNPINDPLFKNLIRGLEKEIRDRNKKRIFDVGENINLHPATIEKIVEELQHIDFFKMDEDIHGRMFESFLDATVRGKELGQYFTPRDIVKLMVSLANLHVTKTHVDTVLDACCGSGGFLISAMSEMLAKADNLVGLSSGEQDNLRRRITDKSLYGIDAGSDPKLHRIARMNMYLHGDGGSNIYFADSLDKRLGQVGRTDIELEDELTELRDLLIKDEEKFAVILSNPPFSMKYTYDDIEQREILKQYSIYAVDKKQKSLLSSIMFLERYKDFAREDTRIFAIIDDSVLSGDSYKDIRDYIRKTFIIVGIISLPGDAFRRANARVKTSVLALRLRKQGEIQKDVFMEQSAYLGLSEKTAKRIGITSNELEKGKATELLRIVKRFQDYLDGIGGEYVVPSENIEDRLDVKFCIKDTGRRKPLWESHGLEVPKLGNVLRIAKQRVTDVSEDEEYTLLKVTYEGNVLESDTKSGEELSYSKLYQVRTWDILFSNMGVGRGAVGIVPSYLDGHYVSNEYTILAASSKAEAIYYSNIIRTKEILGDVLSSTTGMNRGRIKWSQVNSIEIPGYDEEVHHMQDTATLLESLWDAQKSFIEKREQQMKKITDTLGLEDEDSKKRWLAFKPPE